MRSEVTLLKKEARRIEFVKFETSLLTQFGMYIYSNWHVHIEVVKWIMCDILLLLTGCLLHSVFRVVLGEVHHTAYRK